MDHFNSHLALGVDLCELGIDVVTDELGDFGQCEVGYQSDREFAYGRGIMNSSGWIRKSGEETYREQQQE